MLAQSDRFSLLAEKLGTKAMERGEADATAPSAGQIVDAMLHFFGGFVGEGDGQYIPGRDTFFDEMGDARGDDAGLAAARARQNQERPLRMEHGFLLRNV